ncbi:MAG TPA: hypothetical protein VFK19_07800 [Sphingomicrobium sp.]|nr:hypothetical protein [Sphingomicrobium sp.]
MIRLFVLLAFALGTTFAASAATAQSSKAKRYAACVSDRNGKEVRKLMQATSADAANMPYHELINDDRCFSRVFGDQPFRPQDAAESVAMLRGNLAEHALKADAGKIAALQALPLQQKRYIRPWFAATGRHPAVDEMGACMADTDPAGIMALIRTNPGYADEGAAVSALTPALTKCLSAGTRLDANRPALRAALADALYQRMTNPALSVAQSTETPK